MTFGPKEADVTVVTWGSTKGAVLDAMEDLEKEGIKVRLLQIRIIHPFPTKEVVDELSKAKIKVGCEMNFQGQLTPIIREFTGIAMDANIFKYTGRPMKKDEVRDALRDIVKKHSKKVVLTHGA